MSLNDVNFDYLQHRVEGESISSRDKKIKRSERLEFMNVYTPFDGATAAAADADDDDDDNDNNCLYYNSMLYTYSLFFSFSLSLFSHIRFLLTIFDTC